MLPQNPIVLFVTAYDVWHFQGLSRFSVMAGIEIFDSA